MAASSDDRGNERAGGSSEEPEERTDGWMATYADMVTLLMTFFVLMFALSNVDNERAEMFLFALSRGGLTAEQFMEIQQRYNLEEADADEWADMLPAPPGFEDDDDGTPQGGDDGEDEDGGETAGERALRELADAIASYVDIRGLGDVIELSFNGDELLLTLTNDVWFAPGSADISPAMRENGLMIAELLEYNFDPDNPFEVVVAGHTDNRPMNSPRFPSNWHLGNGRATSFLELLLAETDLDPWYFHTRSGGEYRPIADNDTEEGRQKNRRVEVMISLARGGQLWDQPLYTPADTLPDDNGDEDF